MVSTDISNLRLVPDAVAYDTGHGNKTNANTNSVAKVEGFNQKFTKTSNFLPGFIASVGNVGVGYSPAFA